MATPISSSRAALFSWTSVRWPLAFLFLNVPVVAFGMLWVVAFPHDWVVLAQVPARLSDGTLYDHTALYDFVWSPIAAWVLAVVIIPAGYWALFAARVATLPFLGRGLALLTVHCRSGSMRSTGITSRSSSWPASWRCAAAESADWHSWRWPV